MNTQLNSRWNNYSTQPKALYLLFFTEFWERFSFYGLQATLVLYATHYFKFDDSTASMLYGSYLALNYATPVIGGLLADKLIGHRYAIYIGASLLILGNLLLALNSVSFLFMGLAVIILGTGFFKSNISSLVGQLYSENDRRRDGGFTLFYMGINLGGFFGGVIYGYISTHLGWYYCFALGACGMILSLSLFHFKRSFLIESLTSGSRVRNQTRVSTQFLMYILIAAGFLILGFLLSRSELTKQLLEVFGIALFSGILILAFRSTPFIRNRIFALLLFCFYYMAWAACYFQTGSSLTLFIERNIDKHFLGHQIPTAVFFSVEPFFIVSLAPFFARVWLVLAHKKWEPSTPAKFAIGLFLTALSFGVLDLAARNAAIYESSSLWWVVFAYFLMACGELSLSPIGLSAISKLAPRTLVSLFLGTWFFASSLAGFLAGVIANIASLPRTIDGINNLKLAAETYAYTFSGIFWVVLGISVFAMLLIPFTNYLILNQETRDKGQEQDIRVTS